MTFTVLVCIASRSLLLRRFTSSAGPWQLQDNRATNNEHQVCEHLGAWRPALKACQTNTALICLSSLAAGPPPFLPLMSSLHSTSSLPSSLTAMQEYLPPSKVLGLRMLRVSTPWLFCIKYFGSSPIIILFFIQTILGCAEHIYIGVRGGGEAVLHVGSFYSFGAFKEKMKDLPLCISPVV